MTYYMPNIEVIALFDFKKGNILRQGTLKCLKDVLICGASQFISQNLHASSNIESFSFFLTFSGPENISPFLNGKKSHAFA